MASLSSPMFPAMLRMATELKIEELVRIKESFQSRYYGNKTDLTADNNTLERVTALLEEIQKHDPYLEDDDDLTTISRYLKQAKNDNSISESKLCKFEKQLLDKLALHSHRLDVSSLHVELLKEVMNENSSPLAVGAMLENAVLEDDYEMVGDELLSVFETFEKNTFSTKKTDVQALEQHLESLFDGFGKDAIRRLREDMEEHGNDVMDGCTDIDEDMVEWCIKDLAQNGLLSDEKKRDLQGYLQSPSAIRELTSTLNGKSIRHWNWRTPEKGLLVTARQNADSHYCIAVEEDIMDALFLHTIAIGWSMKLKSCLTDMVLNSGLWPRAQFPSLEDMDRQEYYLFTSRLPRKIPPKPSVCTACHVPPPPPQFNAVPPPPPVASPPPPVVIRTKSRKTRASNRLDCYSNNLSDQRDRDYIRDFFLPRLPELVGSSPQITPPEETQAKLIKHLVVEGKVREAFGGDVHLMTANIDCFAHSLPHESILAVLKFCGVPESWIQFFTRFLQAPLNIGPVVRGTADQVLTRTCGVPINHGFELFFGELVMFFLDLAVHQKTGGYLYRLHNKCYVVGNYETCNETAKLIEIFHKTFGIGGTLNLKMDEDFQVGLVTVDIDTRLDFNTVKLKIDVDRVDSYARRIKKQLAACRTALEWIRTWNNTIGTYAPHLFGPLANVFGKSHLEAVTEAYNRIHKVIFEGSNLTDHVKQLLAAHIGHPLRDPPFALEALMYLPTAYGGLGVKNPYITLNLAHEIAENPNAALQDFREAERAYYKNAKTSFEAQQPEARQRKLSTMFNDNQDRIKAFLGDADPATFFSLEDLTKLREQLPYAVLPLPPFPTPIPPFTPVPSPLTAYKELLEERVDHIECSERTHDAVISLARKGETKRWCKLSGEERWVLQLYGDECHERYGGLEMWVPNTVPLEMLKLVRGEEDADGDDDSSYFYD